ncbi:hypothetical protein EMCRGX_G004273 [Ephydatia muelleri]
MGRTAALDVSITSPLNPVTLLEVGVSATAAAQATEARKHQANDPKCSELGWVCVPMVVETYGAWGKETTAIISSVASRLATSTCRPKSTILHEIYEFSRSAPVVSLHNATVSPPATAINSTLFLRSIVNFVCLLFNGIEGVEMQAGSSKLTTTTSKTVTAPDCYGRGKQTNINCP